MDTVKRSKRISILEEKRRKKSKVQEGRATATGTGKIRPHSKYNNLTLADIREAHASNVVKCIKSIGWLMS